MFVAIADFIVDRRRPIMAAFALLFGLSAILALDIDFAFTPQELFETGDDLHEYREVFAERFGREDNLAPLLVETDDIFDPEVLGPIRDLTYELRRHDEIEEAHSVATLSLPRPDAVSAQPHLAEPEYPDDPDELVRGPDLEDDQIEQLAEYARAEPLIAERLVNAEADRGLIAIWVDPDIQDATDLEEILADVDRIVDRYEFPADVSLHSVGLPPLRVEIVEQLRSEQLLFLPLTGLVLLAVLLFLFRRPGPVLLPMATVVIAATATVGAMVVTGSDINIINHILPTLVVVIGVADGIHMVTRQAEEVGLGNSHTDAIKTMVRHTGAACLLTTSTTAVGFLSLLIADTSILRDFGWQAAMGMGFAYLATLFFLSAGLTWVKPVGRNSYGPDSTGPPPLLERALMAVGDRIVARPWTAVTISLLVAGAMGLMAKDMDVDTYVMDILQEDHQLREATETVEQQMGGVMPMEISLEARDETTFRRADVYRKVARLQDYADDQSPVLSTESYVDYMQAARVAVLGDQDERDVLPNSRDEIEQLLVIIADAPDADDDLSNFVTSDWRNARILTRVDDSGANAHLEVAEDLEAHLEEMFGDDDNIDYQITGDAYVAAYSLSAFVRDLSLSLGIALVIIFGMMTVAFRSLKIGLVSLLPNTIPLLMAAGYMGWAGINLDSTTVIIFAIGLGIAVDDSVHFFARFVEEYNRRTDLREAILQTYLGAGRAIMITSLLLLTGMGIISLSAFVPTTYFATLLAIVVAGAILADLLLLPAVLYLVYSKFPGTPRNRARFLESDRRQSTVESTDGTTD